VENKNIWICSKVWTYCRPGETNIHSNPLLTTSKDPCKELLLEGIELTDVPFVSAVMGFALRHPQSRQLLALSLDKVGVGNTEHPCCSTEK